MNKLFIHSPMFRLLGPFPLGTLVYLLILLINNTLTQAWDSFITQELGFSILLTYVNIEINHFTLKRRPFQRFWGNRFNWHAFAVAVVLSMLVTFLAVSTYFIYALGVSGIAPFTTEIATFMITFFLIAILYNLVDQSHFLLTHKNEELIAREEALKASVEGEFKAFHAEVKPRLLYESLEQLIGKLDRDPYDAEDFIDELALVYRYMLTNKDTSFVSLKEDLVAAQRLTSILTHKHGPKLSVTNKISNDQHSIIPGTLPTLVEMAVHENMITKERPLRINLELEENFLVMSYRDNLKLSIDSRGEEFDQIQEAYQFHFDQPAVRIKAYGETFFKIPLGKELHQDTAV